MEAEMENTSTLESERLRVLRLVEEGKISASEGINLLDALQQGQKSKNSSRSGVAGASSPRWFRVRVTNLETGRSKATVNIPIGLAEWGLRIGARFAPEVADFDLAELSKLLSEQGLEGKIIDVLDDEDGEHVEIFIE
jgi:SHOCT-like domain